MTSRGVPNPGQWVKVKLPGSGRPALVTTRFENGRRLVVVKPIKE